jgi:hypothetical protein
MGKVEISSIMWWYMVHLSLETFCFVWKTKILHNIEYKLLSKP